MSRKVDESKKWVIINLIAVFAPVAIYFALVSLYGERDSGDRVYGFLSASLILFSLCSLLISVVAIFKLRGKTKLLPVSGAIVSLIFVCISILIAAMGMFASSH